MASVVAVSSRHHPRVPHSVRCVVREVAVDSLALFRRDSAAYAAVTIIFKDPYLATLVCLGNLIPGVVGVGRSRIDTAGVPDHLFDFGEPPERIFGEPSLAPFLILRGRYLATGAATAAVDNHFCRAVHVGGLCRPTIPIVTLLHIVPATGIVARGNPAAGDLRGIRLHNRPSHVVIDDNLAG